MPLTRRFLLVPWLALATGDAQAQSLDSPARIQFAPPPFDLPADVRDSVQFGWLTVPQDHDSHRAGHIRIALAIIAARTNDPAADPIVLIPGGPGDAQVATSTVAIARSHRVGLHRMHRAVIVLDPRGHGLSDPHMCPELYEAVPLSTTDAAAEAVFLQHLDRCRDLLQRRGVRLDLLNSWQAARDLDSLRAALGVPHVNLIGASYGSHIAAVAARDLPGLVRTAMLHGPVPPGAFHSVSATDEVMAVLFARCAQQTDCRRAYPSLAADLRAILAAAARNPLSLQGPVGETIQVDSALLHTNLGELGYARDLIAGAPALLHALARDDRDLLARLAPTMSQRLATPAASYGTQLAFRCNDGTTDSALIRRCRAWVDAAPRPPSQFTSAVPTLIFAGEFDTRTPPSMIPLMARNFSRAQGFVIPWYGHEGLPDCVFRMTDAFIVAPDRPLGAACLDSVPPVRFATDARPARWLSRGAAAAAGARAALLLPAGVGLLLCLGLLPLLALSLLRRSQRRTAGVWANAAAAAAACAGVLLALGAIFAAISAARQSLLVLAVGLPAGFHWLGIMPWLLAGLTLLALVLHIRVRRQHREKEWLRGGAIAGAAILVCVWSVLAFA